MPRFNVLSLLQKPAKLMGSPKRASHRTKVTFHDHNARTQELDLVQLDDALTLLETLDQRQSEIVTLKFFGGLQTSKIAHIHVISKAP